MFAPLLLEDQPMPNINLFFWMTLSVMALVAALLLIATQQAEADALLALRRPSSMAAGKRRKSTGQRIRLTTAADNTAVPAFNGDRQTEGRPTSLRFFNIETATREEEPYSIPRNQLQYELPRAERSTTGTQKKMAAASSRHHCA
jgi:hypothetical protein